MGFSDGSSYVCSADLFAVGLAGAGETDVGGGHAACERRLEFAARRDVEPVDEPRHKGEERRIGVRLHRIMKLDLGGHRSAPFGDARGEHRAVVTEKRSEEHTSELQSLMRSSYAVFCLKKK